MDSLILKLTGPPEATFRGQALKFRSRKVFALLIYLVIEAGAHSREKMTALFWPESDETRARASFRNTLLRLRQSLGPAGEYLLVDSETVAFDFSQPHQINLDPPGEFLEGFSLRGAPGFDRWVSVQREAHKQRLDKHFDRLTEEQLDARKIEQAIATATEWLGRNPLNEAAARRSMQGHFLAGDRSGALAVYASLERTLAEELNLPPSSETSALAESIRRSVPQPAAQTPAQPGLALLPFVGRAAEHARLTAAHRRVRRGETRATCVEGEAGMGKTRLVETFLDWAALQGPVDVLRGRTFEVGGRLPYQPLVDAMRTRLDAENAPEDLLPDVWLAELSQLLPELRERYPDLPKPLSGNPEFTRSRLFEAVAVLGQALAARKPLVVFMDDLQWADTGTLDLLHYLARRWTEGRESVLFIWTVRSENLAGSLQLREWLAQMERGIPLDRVQLPPLGYRDIRQLVDYLVGAVGEGDQAVEKFSQWLKIETAGQPFFIAEMLKMLEERGILMDRDVGRALRQVREAGRVPVPPTVRELILARAARLSAGAGALLLAAAVVGREASFETLCQIADLEEEIGLSALEGLLNSRLLVQTGGQRPYRCAHDNIRDVMYGEAGEARRRIYHRRALASLEGRAAAAELAFHADAAGMHAAAFEYAFAAGDEAMDKFAFADAVAQYGRALKGVGQVEITPQKRCDLYVRYGRALELNGAYAGALAHYQEMESLARSWGDRPLELAALTAQGTIYATANDQSDMARGEELCQRALVLAQELGDKATQAKIQWNLLNVYRMTQRNELALAAGEQSLALAEMLGMSEQIAYTTNDLGYIYQAQADIENMNRVLAIAVPLWRELGNLPMLTDSLTSRANNLLFVGDLNSALELSQEAQTISKSLNNPWSQSFTLFTPCYVHWYKMQVSKALDAMQRCIALGREAGFVGGIVTMSNYQAQLLLELGQTEMAQEVMQGIRATAERNIPIFLTGASGADALIAMHQGDLGKAADTLRPFVFDDPPFDMLNSFLMETSYCELLLRTGGWGKLSQITQKITAFLRDRGYATFLPQFLYLQAQAFYELGEGDKAWDTVQEALHIGDETGVRWKRWQLLNLGAMIAESRHQKKSIAQLRQQARETINWIAEQCHAEKLQAAFLARPEVDQILQGDSPP